MKTLLLLLLTTNLYAQFKVGDVTVTDEQFLAFGKYCLSNYDTIQYVYAGEDTLRKFHHKAHPIIVTKRQLHPVFFSQGFINREGFTSEKTWYDLRNEQLHNTYKFIIVDAWNETWYLVPIEFNQK